MAYLDGGLAWPCPNCGGKGGHCYMSLVTPSSCAIQGLPRTTAVLEQLAASRGMAPVEIGALKEVKW